MKVAGTGFSGEIAMRNSLIIPAAIAAGLLFAPYAYAQDAAESAAIMAGSAGTGGAQRSLGRSISGAIGGAANSVRSTGGTTARPYRGQSAASAPRSTGIVLGTGDVLENTDAAKYQTEGGAGITVSGSLRPAPGARCVKNCSTAPE